MSAAASASAAELWTPAINVENPDLLVCYVVNVSTKPRQVEIELFDTLDERSALASQVIDAYKTLVVGASPKTNDQFHCKVTVQKKKWIRVSACVSEDSVASPFACVGGN